jgi:hypothetical protein
MLLRRRFVVALSPPNRQGAPRGQTTHLRFVWRPPYDHGSRNRLFGIQFAPNHEWQAPYGDDGSVLDSGKTRERGRKGGENSRRAQRERSAQGKQAYQRAGERVKNQKPQLAQADTFTPAAREVSARPPPSRAATPGHLRAAARSICLHPIKEETPPLFLRRAASKALLEEQRIRTTKGGKREESCGGGAAQERIGR